MIKKKTEKTGRGVLGIPGQSNTRKLIFPGTAVYIWLTGLSPLSVSDTRYSIYLLVAVISLLCLYDNVRSAVTCDRKQRCVLSVCSGLFGVLVALANWQMFLPLSVLENVFDIVCVVLGGFAACYQILLCMWNRLPLSCQAEDRIHGKKLFLAVFLSVSVIDILYLFLVLYPGVVPWDAYSTIGQGLGEVPYDNMMPFWHTVTVEVFIKSGLKLFGNMNAAVAFFHCGQILFMAAAFAYAVMTIYQIGAPLAAVFGVYFLYAAAPHNIVLSVTLLKDVPFGGAALIFVTALYRLLSPGVKAGKWDSAALVLGILGFSLWRTNGWYAFAAVTLLMLVLLRKEHKKLLILMLVLLLVGWILIGPVLDALNVTSTNFVEAFAVPMQQIARVIHNERPLTQEETALLAEIFWMDKVKELYDPGNVDPVKFEAFRSYSDNAYIMEHAGEYLSLYLRLGLRYPADYLQAWIEQTKGFWNGGYNFWTYSLKMGKNDEFGIVQIQKENLLASLYRAWFRYAAKLEIIQFWDSIGLYSWILGACCAVSALRKRKEFLLTVPLLVLVLGLCFGTPIFAEFRYAYPMIVTTPFILTVTLFCKETGK